MPAYALPIALLYLLWRLVWPLRWPVAARLLLALGIAAVANWYQLQKLIWGTMFSPEMPRWAVMVMGGLFVAFLMLVLVLILADVLLALAWLVKRRPLLTRSGRNRLHGALLAAVLALTGAGLASAVAVPEVKRVDMPIAGLPAALEGFRLVQLSDLHISTLMPAPWVRGVVARTNALAPDAIVITGDLIDGSPAARRADVAPLAGLRARHGVFASLGNHEYYFGAQRWSAAFQALGLRVLDNAHAVLTHQGAPLVIAAVGDPVAHWFGQAAPDVHAALQGAPAGAPVVLLAHRPINMAEHARAGVHLHLAGHTHGGMLRGPMQWAVRRANGGVVSGLYDFGPMRLYISNGTGLWNGFPVRLGVPSEITEFTLRRAAPS